MIQTTIAVKGKDLVIDMTLIRIQLKNISNRVEIEKEYNDNISAVRNMLLGGGTPKYLPVHQ